MVAYVNKLKMLKIKAKAKYKAPFKNAQYQIAGVSFTGGKPNYCLSSKFLFQPLKWLNERYYTFSLFGKSCYERNYSKSLR